jgi:MFS family permease
VPFVMFGFGMAFPFVGAQIGAQAEVAPADAGIASGLINTSVQIGIAVAVALAATLAASASQAYAEDHPGTEPVSAAALTHGYEIAYLVCAGIALAAATLAAVMFRSQPAQPASIATSGAAAESEAA